MNALVTAGGIPKPDNPLYQYTQGKSKALMEIAGKPMIQWVLDALSEAKTIDQVIIVGLPPDSEIQCTKPLAFLPNQGAMLDNVRAGVKRSLELLPTGKHTLIVSSDIPALTAEMVDWAVNIALETDHDLYYNVITSDVMEARFPNSKRSYIRMKDVEVCGGDMNVTNNAAVVGNDELWSKLIAARKSAFKQVAMVGYGTLILFFLRQLTLEQMASRASNRVGFRGRAILCPYAEIGMDVDKPYQLELLRSDLARRQKVR